ncbi:hypothetical protein GALMADRAFT_256438 [Galerina marginata CBS 339.88]|uniref:Ribosomal protein/NADH dehydrogenase domain-containing protein n=1 Tax=Galerina marginata (strain CBS 339.88) TaxID=685588 RepID=A0A067SCK0_GALM3|nr:hypothetical protein GALMADRAFT_256438 [Galerina marginata CBS 339.88]
MPPRSETIPGGIVKLTKLLSHLNASPKLSLFGVKKLRLSLASQNDHFGARHFVKEDLPRIRWVNPNLDIEVQREQKKANEHWRTEMEVEFDNGIVQKVDMQDKRSTTILKELMDVAGGDPWKRHVVESQKSGMPVLSAEREKENLSGKTLPTLQEYLKQNPTKKAEHTKNSRTKAPKPVKDAKLSSSSPPINPFATLSVETATPPPS